MGISGGGDCASKGKVGVESRGSHRRNGTCSQRSACGEGKGEDLAGKEDWATP